MAEIKYKYGPEHEEVYNKLLNAVPLKEHIKRTIKHRNALPIALEVLKDKEIGHIDEGIELLADALIQYRKKAGIPVSDKEEDRHRYIDEVRQFIEQYGKQKKVDVEAVLKQGNAHEILLDMLQGEAAHDLIGKLNYEMQKILPPDKGFDFYHGMAHFHASRHPTIKFSKGTLARMASRDSILEQIAGEYSQHASNELKEYNPPKEVRPKKHEHEYKKAA